MVIQYGMRLFFLWAITTTSTMSLQAQPTFKECMILYNADTLERVVSRRPNNYYITQMRLYKKGQWARHEIISINSANQLDTIRTIQIRNDKGVYICLDASFEPEKIAFLSSYEEDRINKINRAKKGNFYTDTVEKTGQQVQLLGIKTERVLLKRPNNVKSFEALISTGIEAPLSLFYESLSQVRGTPLQFVVQEDDWLIRYTAKAIDSRVLPKTLFEVGPTFRVISMKQLEEMDNPKK